MTDPLAEVAAVAAAIAGLGGSATAGQLAARLGWPLGRVTRRLCSAGSMSPSSVPRYFRVLERRQPRIGTAAVWGLTDRGRQAAASTKEAA